MTRIVEALDIRPTIQLQDDEGLAGYGGGGKTPERHEALDLSGHSILAFGASRGWGLAAARMWAEAGAQIALGATSVQTYSEGLEQLTDEGIPTDKISPLVARVERPKEVSAAIDKVPFERPTAVIWFPAIGMQGWGMDFTKKVWRMNSTIKREGRESELLHAQREDMNDMLDVALPQSLPESILVNIQAPILTLEFLKEHYGGGFAFIYPTSTFVKEGKGFRYYTNVLFKGGVSMWLRQNGQRYADKWDIDTMEVIAPALGGGTNEVGNIFLQDVAKTAPKDIEEKLVTTAITEEQALQPVNEFLMMSKAERARHERPYTRWVLNTSTGLYVGRDIPENLREELDIDTTRLGY